MFAHTNQIANRISAVQTSATRIAALMAVSFLCNGTMPPRIQAALVPPTIVHPARDDRDGNGFADSLDQALQWGAASETIDVIVTTRVAVTEGHLQKFEAWGGEITHVYHRVLYGFAGSIPAQRVGDFASDIGDELNAVRLDGQGFADLENSSRQIRARPFGSCQPTSEYAWCYDSGAYRGDTDSSIAVVGSGVDVEHTDLGDSNWGTWSDPVVAWYDVTGVSNSPYDPTGHETLTSGIIAGQGLIDSEVMGVAPDTHLVGLRFGNSASNFIAACEWILDDTDNPPTLNRDEYGIKIMTLSWHYRNSNDADDDAGTVAAVETLVDNGILVTCSAGNQHHFDPGHFDYHVGYPGQSEKVITVGATTTDSLGDGFKELVAGYSSNGESTLPAKPDLVAPGGGCCPAGRINGPNASSQFIIDNFSAGCYDSTSYESVIAPSAGDRNVAYRFTTPPGNLFAIDLVSLAAQPPNAAAAFDLDVWFASDSNFAPGSMVGSQLQFVSESNDVPSYEPVGILLLSANTSYWLVTSVPASSASTEVRWYENGNGQSGGVAIDEGTGWIPFSGALGGFEIKLNTFVRKTFQQKAGTSFSTPHVAGTAALVIQALEATGGAWQFTIDEVMQVKSLIQMTATETTFVGENATDCDGETNNPQDNTLDRGAKDRSEGYGRLNADAAVEAASQTWDLADDSSYLGDFYESTKKCWARKFTVQASVSPHVLSLAVPAFADFDLYVYRETPGVNGEPVIVTSSTNDSIEDDQNDEQVGLCVDEESTFYVVVKWVEGAGTFTLSHAILSQILCPEEPVSPAAGPSGSRSIDVASGNEGDSMEGTPVAFLIRSPAFPCLESYVQIDGTLGPAPVFQTPVQWGVISVIDEDIVPGTTYEVYTDAGTPGEPLLSEPTVVTTWGWADMDNNGVVNFIDIDAVVRGFQGDFSQAPLVTLDIWPCLPNGVVNFDDIFQTVRAFQQNTFEDEGCSLPCN